MLKDHLAILLSLLIFVSGCAVTSKQPQGSIRDQQFVAKTTPITIAKLYGHQTMYDEGWTIFATSQSTFDYVKDSPIISSPAVFVDPDSINAKNDALSDMIAQHWALSADAGRQWFLVGK